MRATFEWHVGHRIVILCVRKFPETCWGFIANTRFIFSFIRKFAVDLDSVRLLADQQFCFRILHHIRGRLESPSIRQFKYNQPLEQMRIQANVYLLYLYLILLSLTLSLPLSLSPFRHSIQCTHWEDASILLPDSIPIPTLRAIGLKNITHTLRHAHVATPNRPHSHTPTSIIQFANFHSNKISEQW